MLAKNINLKIIIILLIIALFYSVNAHVSYAADIGPRLKCDPVTDYCKPEKGINYSCLSAPNPLPDLKFMCQPDAFGKILPPDPLKKLLEANPTGEKVISMFLSNAVTLIFSLAGVVLVFMIIWGAFDWMISEGEKEKVAAARNKIISAIIGIILFAIAFAIIRILGQFTGFTFFKNQNINIKIERVKNGTSIMITCPDGIPFFVPYSDYPDTSVCRGLGAN